MKHTITLILMLALLWLLNSGHYTPLITGLGCLSILLVVVIVHMMDVADHETAPFQLNPRLPLYCAWLAREVVLANMAVVICIWRGKRSIDPAVGTVKVSQKSDVYRVAYANSITLTPGTVTIDLQDDSIRVHALTRKGLRDLESGTMDRQVSALEKNGKSTGSDHV